MLQRTKVKIRKITALLMSAAIFITALTSTACSKEEINGVDPSTPVAHIEDPPDGKKELFTVKYKDFFGEYNFFMSRGGYTEEGDPELALNQRDNVIKYLVQERVILYLAEQAGITEKTFSEAEKKTIEETVQETVDDWCDSYRSDALSRLGETFTDEELYNKELELFSAFLAESGLTVDIFRTWETNALIREKYIAAVSDELSAETVTAFVQDTINQARDKYENDLAVFEQSYTAFYVPEGSHRVQQILIKISDTAISEVAAYRKDGDDEKAEEILNEALEKVKYKADEAYSKLQNGESWDVVQAEYNDETDTNGVDFMIYPRSTTVNPEVTDTAMSISEPGLYSSVHQSDSGYFIIYYSGKAEMSEERLAELDRQGREFLADEETFNKITAFIAENPFIYDYDLLGLEEGSLAITTTAAESDVS